MVMKLFLFEFGSGSSTPEKAVVLAENKKEAIELVSEEEGMRYGDETLLENLDGELHSDNLEFRVAEIDLNKPGVVYVGKYCC